jgi:hypothetical protein
MCENCVAEALEARAERVAKLKGKERVLETAAFTIDRVMFALAGHKYASLKTEQRYAGQVFGRAFWFALGGTVAVLGEWPWWAFGPASLAVWLLAYRLVLAPRAWRVAREQKEEEARATAEEVHKVLRKLFESERAEVMNPLGGPFDTAPLN